MLEHAPDTGWPEDGHDWLKHVALMCLSNVNINQWRTEGGLGCSTPPPEIPKALQNRAKLNPIVKTVKNC